MAEFKKKKTESDKKRSAYKKIDTLTKTELTKLKKTTTIRLIVSAVLIFASVYFSLWIRNISGLGELLTEDFSSKLETLAISIPAFDWDKYLNAVLINLKISVIAVPIGSALTTAYNIIYRLRLSAREDSETISDAAMLAISRVYAIMVYIIWFFIFACAFLYKFYRLVAYWAIDSAVLRYGALAATLAIYIWIAFIIFFIVWHEINDFFTASPLGVLHTENIGTYVLGIAFCTGTSYFLITAAASVIAVTAIKGIRSMRRKMKRPRFFDGFAPEKENSEEEEMIIAEAEKEEPQQIEDDWEELLIPETDNGPAETPQIIPVPHSSNETPADEEWEKAETISFLAEEDSPEYISDGNIRDKDNAFLMNLEDKLDDTDEKEWIEI